MKNLKLIMIVFFFCLGLYSQTASSQVTQRWAARYNGSGNAVDNMSDMIVDNSGNVFVCGISYRSQTNTNDAALIKYDSAGTVVWSSFYTGIAGSHEILTAMAIDNSGNIYVTGRSLSVSSAYDVLTLKYNSAGALQWDRKIGGAVTGDDLGRDITVDAAGNICVVSNVNMGLTSGFTDIAVIKYDPAGNYLISGGAYTYNFAGDAIDIPFAITTDAANNIYVAGTWGGDNGFGGINSQITTLSLTPAGALRWVKQYGTPAGLPMEGYDIKCDNAGDVLVTGKVQKISNGQYETATLKYSNANGTLLWAQRFSGAGSLEDITKKIAIDDSNNVYVTGYNFRTTNRDQIVIKYSSTGIYRWAVAYNHPSYNGSDEGQDIIIRGRWIYTSGWVSGPTQKDYLIMKYDRYTGAEMWARSYFGPSSGDDGAFRIGLDASQNVIVSGDSFGGASNFDWATIKFIQTPPAAPVLVTPANGATGVSLTATLDWNDVPDADTYQLQVSTSSTFSTTVINLGTLTASQYTIPSGILSSNTQYYWRVTAFNEYGYSAIAGPRSFTTVPLPPAAPTLVAPVNGATGTSVTPLLDWNDVSGAATYNVQVSTNSGFTTTVLNQTGVTTSQLAVASGILSNNVLYYWRVAAVNPGGVSAWSSVWNFRPALTGVNSLSGEIPKEFKLYDNYPNPFNPVTRIKFDIASNTQVTLVVYDIVGRVVATLVDQELVAGIYETSFEGSNLSSGVYFYRLNAGSYTSIKRMILTK